MFNNQLNCEMNNKRTMKKSVSIFMVKSKITKKLIVTPKSNCNISVILQTLPHIIVALKTETNTKRTPKTTPNTTSAAKMAKNVDLVKKIIYKFIKQNKDDEI